MQCARRDLFTCGVRQPKKLSRTALISASVGMLIPFAADSNNAPKIPLKGKRIVEDTDKLLRNMRDYPVAGVRPADRSTPGGNAITRCVPPDPH